MSSPAIPRILVIVPYYLPGVRGGGPVRSVAGMVQALSAQFEFRVATLNHDLRDPGHPYPGIRPDEWTTMGPSPVFYASVLSLARIRKLIAEVKPDALYLNSALDSATSRVLLGMLSGFLPRIPLVIAPRGEFSAGALSLKSYKKRPYLALMRRIGAYRNVTWHASAAHEVADIQRVTSSRRIVLAPQISTHALADLPRPTKRPGSVRLVFLSRISKMKNLTFLLDLLKSLKGDVELAIYGPAEDLALWRDCEAQIAALPPNVRVRYGGEVRHDEVPRVLRESHFFVLPTLGENFGHAIVEALHTGVPVIISDRTPWRDLAAANAGCDLPLEPSSWVNALHQTVALDDDAYAHMVEGALAYAARTSSPELIEKQAAVFVFALRSARRL